MSTNNHQEEALIEAVRQHPRLSLETVSLLLLIPPILLLLDREDDAEKEAVLKSRRISKICRSRITEGEYFTLFPKLLQDEIRLHGYFRMKRTQFQTLLTLIHPQLVSPRSHWKNHISPEQKLVVCLRYVITIHLKSIKIIRIS